MKAAPPIHRSRWRTAPEDMLGTLLLAGVFLVMVAGVFFRYVLNDSLIWTEELARYGLVLLTFTGIATGFRAHSHIRIDLIDRAPPAVARLARALVSLTSAAFLVFLIVQALGLSQVLRTSRSAALNIPMAFLYYAVAFAVAIGLARLLCVAYGGLRRMRP